MRPAHTAYLETLRDEQQYPGARCNATIDDSDADHEAPDIFLYGLTASSGVESMNSANKDLRKRSAVDILNAGMILLKKEGIRFNRTVQDAHMRRLQAILVPGLNPNPDANLFLYEFIQMKLYILYSTNSYKVWFLYQFIQFFIRIVYGVPLRRLQAILVPGLNVTFLLDDFVIDGFLSPTIYKLRISIDNYTSLFNRLQIYDQKFGIDIPLGNTQIKIDLAKRL